ncbi:MAG: cyclase family protein [Bacteroidetes bacterium]|nr:cyclase family protein [Bacteroidota bacterium]
MNKAIDLTQEIYTGMPIFPGHLKSVVWEYLTHDECKNNMEDGYSYRTNGLLISDHGPTHIDAVSHIDPDPSAPSIDEMSLDTFFGKAICLDLSFLPEHSLIEPDDIKKAEKAAVREIEKGDIVLFYIGHFDKYYPTHKYLQDYSGFSYDSAVYLIEEKGIKNWGTDTPSPDRPPTKTYPVHQHYKKTRVPHMENLCNLDQIINKEFMFYGFPLRIRKGSGSPIRAVAVI